MKKVIVISGGSDGLGKHITKQLAEDHIVVILSPTKDKLLKAAHETGCDYRVCDITDPEQVNK